MHVNPSHPYICGDAFKNLAAKWIERSGVTVNPNGEPDVIYVESDLISSVMDHIDSKCIVLSHNGDTGFCQDHLGMLNDKRIVAWYAQNAHVAHPKLHPLPIGIANSKWSHGCVATFDAALRFPIAKSKLFCAHYNNRTTDRERCATATGVEPTTLSIPDYHKSLGESYFTLSPAGFGLDCHRTWEALYFKSIPIVPSATMFDSYPYPIIQLDAWSDFSSLNLSPELYDATWKDFDVTRLTFDSFVGEFINLEIKGLVQQ